MDDAQQTALEQLAGAMFAGEIAQGAVVVNDPAAPEPPVVEATPTPQAPAAETPQPATPDVESPIREPEPAPTFKANLDDDLQALLDEPDFEEEARTEITAELEDGDGDYEYETNPELAAKMRALEKRNKYLEDRNVAISKKNWVEEAKRVFPDLARVPGEIEGIQASSRRAFIKEANTRNEKYKAVFAPFLAQYQADKEAIATAATTQAREEVAQAWGKPAADTLPPAAEAARDALEKARAKGDLEGGIKALMDIHPVL